ncbi:MAG: hypothetical protein CW716_11860 [Candidatus Bathyarchaeum sp.]|nr:MAG: hypothetical protein CW716_11860 [Candidatus Bathyarchaeum sp.]
MNENNSIKIDETDVTILRALLKEARTTFTDIAKECKISIAAARARSLRLQKIGIINGAVMQVNPYSLGFDNVCDITMKVAPEKIEEVKKFLTSKPYTGPVLENFGRQNIAVGVLLKSINELNNIMEDIAKCEHVKNVEPLIWIKPVYLDHPENLVIAHHENKNGKNEAVKSLVKYQKRAKLGDLELQIAKILTNDARTPFSAIGKKLKIPTQTVIRKYKKLSESVFTTSTITINLQKLGYKAIAIIFIKIPNKAKEQKIHSEILQIPNVIVAIRHIGIYDMRVLIALEDFDDWFETEKKIKKIEGIKEIDTSFIKAYTKWPLNPFANIFTEENSTKNQMKTIGGTARI